MQRAEAGNSPADDNPPADPPAGDPPAGDPPADPPAGDPLPPPQITGLIHLLVGAAATALMTGVVIYLIYLGDRGNTIAGPLALLVGFITLVVTLLLYLASAGVIQLHPRPWLRAAFQGVATFFIVGSFGATAAFIGVAVIDRQIPITNLIQIENSKLMTNADTAIVEITRADSAICRGYHAYTEERESRSGKLRRQCGALLDSHNRRCIEDLSYW